MKKHYVWANAMLWAAAILAAALLKAPHFLVFVLLPLLATLSLCVVGHQGSPNRSDIP